MKITQNNAAYISSFAYHEDNLLLLKASLEQIKRRTQHLESIRLLSLGIGHRYVVTGLLEALRDRLKRYVIVEGSQAIIDLLMKETTLPDQASITHAFFEHFDTEERFDVIEMGFVLEHVEDPDLIIDRFKTLLAPEGSMLIAVPNAYSLHRLIGKQAGLMGDLHSLSEADIALGHRRYFDSRSLECLLLRHGLEITARAGLMLKPFTSFQLASLELDQHVRDAMNEIGYDLPDVCNGIFVEARLCR